MATSPTIEELESQFGERGYLIIEGLLTPAQVEAAKTAMDRLVDLEAEKLIQAGKLDDPMTARPFETRLLDLYRDHLELAPNSYRYNLQIAELFDFFYNPNLLDIVERILGPEIRLYPNYTVRPKFPRQEQHQVLWHQDGGYTARLNGGQDVEELRMVNVWSPLVPATVENGCMQFVPGSHKLGVVPHEEREYYLEIPREVMAERVADVVDVEVDPGDVVLFHNLLFHQGQPNVSDHVRWSLDWRYQDATQPTMRDDEGHLARSKAHPEQVIGSAEQWGRTDWR